MKVKNVKYLLTLMVVSVQLLFAQADLKTIADKAVSTLLTGKNPLKGIVIGIIRGDQKLIYNYGELVKESKDINPGYMLFEVASVTKNLTALLLAQSVSEGFIKYDDTAVIVNKKEITWKQLVTHTSGLPNLPDNITHTSEYGKDDFEKFLTGCNLINEPGKQFSYSTVGYSLLGKLLASKRGYKSYDECLKDIILKPMGLLSSGFNDADVNKDFYTGDILQIKKRKKDSVFNPSGGLISTPDDLLTLIKANLNPEGYPRLLNAIKTTQQTFKNIATFPGSIAALGWHYFDTMKLYWNSGVSDQFRCVIMFDVINKCGIVILTNTHLDSADSRLEAMGFGLMGQLRKLK